MFQLHVIATGSDGNCYTLEGEKAPALLLDAGVPARFIRQGTQWDHIRAALITHEHKDHAAAVPDMLKRGIDCYMSAGTAHALGLERSPFLHIVRPNEYFQICPYSILPFIVTHDAEEPLGFLIQDTRSRETLCYFTDTGEMPYTFADVNYFLAECNYCEDLLLESAGSGKIGQRLHERLRIYHMGLERLKNILSQSELSKTKMIILCHLSATRSDEARMVSEIASATGKPTMAADAGLTFILADAPF